ncbi:hypothetical protein BZA70DRAFT_277846 [Myxozyma melibiosi]|uniref:Uncharacterized protein n=1 Tax=Myxozyma melibiosi TaxID=54550 RepID=A0ABR1F8B5_9ASCO
MSRKVFLRNVPLLLAIGGGVYTGYEVFDPLFREERDRLIREGVLVLPEEVGKQPEGTTVTGDVPLSDFSGIPPDAIQINPFEPLLHEAAPAKSYWHYLRHPTELLGSKPLSAADVEHMKITTTASKEK